MTEQGLFDIWIVDIYVKHKWHVALGGAMASTEHDQKGELAKYSTKWQILR